MIPCSSNYLYTHSSKKTLLLEALIAIFHPGFNVVFYHDPNKLTGESVQLWVLTSQLCRLDGQAVLLCDTEM